ncbi:MAG: hypothetical protein HZB76_05775 [Chlamydiae bacterium]|nr:hypothetical protein [Chlamydiota bacterium]
MKDEKIKFSIINIVWGNDYLDLFLNIIIPSYLSKNNIPFCSKIYDIQFNIYTAIEDVIKIKSHKSYLKLQEFVVINVFPIITSNLLKENNKYSVKGFCQSAALKKAAAEHTIALLFNPDTIISDGSLKNCCLIMEKSKKKSIVIAELARVEIESITPHLKAVFNSYENSISLSSRELVALSVQHLLPIGKVAFWEYNLLSTWPSFLYWKAGKNSILAKFFHLHPLAIDLREVNISLPETIMPDDGGLLEFLGIEEDKIHVVTDSDSILGIELSRKALFSADVSRQVFSKSWGVIKWSYSYALPSHQKNLLKFNIRFQSNENINWKKIETKVFWNLFFVRQGMFIIELSKTIRRMIPKKIKSWIKNKLFSEKKLLG